MDDKRKVAITGLGVISPLGLDERTFWQNLLAGRSAIRRIQSRELQDLKCANGAEIENAALAAALEARGWKPSDRAVDMALLAGAQALEQAGLIAGNGPCVPQPLPSIFGSGNGPSHSIFEVYQAFAAKGVRGPRPTAVLRGMINAVSARISLNFKLTGANYTIVSACTSSTIAMGIGWRMIRDGYAQQVLCGGVDTLFTPAIFSAWNNLGAMSRNRDPARASRPFDRDRDGLVLGEGAGAVVLEAYDRAIARQARLRGMVCGYGESSDASHIAHPAEAGQARAMRLALESAGVAPSAIGFINAHGTATKTNDACESRSIRTVFGDLADRIPVSANKSSFGHLMGASGVVESIAALLSLETGVLPPNLNLENPDPACRIRLVGSRPLACAASLAMKNSFGFGGSNAVLILGRHG